MGKRDTDSRGRWQVARERLRLADSRPPPPDPGAKQIGDVLPDLMKRIGLESDHWLTTLAEEWPEVAGAGVAVHSRPGLFADRVLTVYVDSPVWMQELSRGGRGPLLDNLRTRYGAGKIREVRFQLDPD